MAIAAFVMVWPTAGRAESKGVTLSEGDKVLPVALVNQDGKEITIGASDGRAVVLTFIFSRCPVASFCPAMSANFAQIQEAMRKDSTLAGKVHLISVSIDPAFDTPEVLKRYSEHFALDNADWSFVTGKPEDVAKLTAAFSLFMDSSAEGSIDHTLATALIGPDGRIRKFWRNNQWTPEDILKELQVTLAESPSAPVSGEKKS